MKTFMYFPEFTPKRSLTLYASCCYPYQPCQRTNRRYHILKEQPTFTLCGLAEPDMVHTKTKPADIPICAHCERVSKGLPKRRSKK